MNVPRLTVALAAVLSLSACASTTAPVPSEPSPGPAPLTAPASPDQSQGSTQPAPQAIEPGRKLELQKGVKGRTQAAPVEQGAQVAAPATAPAPAAALPTSRLAGMPWGVYKGPAEMAWDPYVRASGEEKRLLGHIALAPKAKWFGDWIPDNEIAKRTREYIQNSQNGNPDVLVQMTVFRMDPWYQESKRRVPTEAEIKSYKRWIRNQVAAIGNTKVAIVLQPDLTFLRTVPNFKLSSGLIRFAARQYGSLPNALVYLESGAWDWPHPGQGGAPEAVRLLSASGIEFVDGIATNTTHYSSTKLEIQRVAEIVQIFERRGIKGLKGVINTSSNGNPFDFGKYQGPDPDHAWACKSKTDPRTCVALGIPPTANVGAARWGLDDKTRALARKYVDAYLWIGRPWLYRQNSPFQKDRALKLVRTWRYLPK